MSVSLALAAEVSGSRAEGIRARGNVTRQKRKNKFHPGRGHEGPEGELKYSCTLY